MNRRHFCGALAALLFPLTGCGDKPKLSRLGSDAVVLAFGDSLTFGTGASEAESYPAQLAALIGRTVVAAGVPGEISATGLARLPSAIEEHQPRLLLLCHGGNDFLQRRSKSAAAANVRAMIRLAKDKGMDAVLIGTPEPGITVSPPEFYEEIATSFGIPYEGDVLGKVLKDSSLKADQVHPNARGYRVIAEKVAELLRKAGAV
jgi:lysophospholipase L1-like esterase